MGKEGWAVGTGLLAATWAVGAAIAVGPEWCEPAVDTSSIPGQATPITGPPDTGLVRFDGKLEGGAFPSKGGDFQDIFLVYVADPALFSASVETAGTNFDTQMWLFSFDDIGILGNDDDPAGGPLSVLPVTGADDGTMSDVEEPGLYYIAVTGFDSDPVDANSQPIFIQKTRQEVSGPDGSIEPFDRWQPPAGPEVGDYSVFVTGINFIYCPVDLSNNGFVDFADILIVIANWGPCPPGGPCPADLNGNLVVDFADILIIIEEWGRCENIPE
ncbi:MAG: DVUA0089 family protein [Planctomycetota bacterium]|jgi:hypothetical protein